MGNYEYLWLTVSRHRWVVISQLLKTTLGQKESNLLGIIEKGVLSPLNLEVEPGRLQI